MNASSPTGVSTREHLSRSPGSHRGQEMPPAPPIRIVHFGLGAFHRAHQVWYTAMADDGDEWGFASLTGRSADAARVLARQDGLFTLIERSEQGDRAQIVGNLVEAVDGADLKRTVELIAAHTTAVITMTVTEAGYRLTPDGLPDPNDEPLAEDLRNLSTAFASGDTEFARTAAPTTTLGRLLAGLAERRNSGGGPLAIVPCDNIPDNGAFVRHGLLALAARADESLSLWIAANVSFVSTSVDRITPRATEADSERAAELTGYEDGSPVVTEPFSDWILSGEFPAGRPRWESGGARFVEDIEPFERRKLWLLNGAHTYLAYAGLRRGYRSVAEAIADPALRRDVETVWAEASAHLPADLLELERYRTALIDRFANARIEHRLEQIAMEGVAKLRVRLAPIALAERSAGRPATGCARGFAAWIELTRREVLPDSQRGALHEALSRIGGDDIRDLLALVEPALAADPDFVKLVRDCLAEAETP